MAKRRQEERPPLELPLARLFLDDLEELGRVFLEARNKWEDRPPQEGEMAPRIIYRVDDWECDTIQDLKEIGRMKSYFEVRLEEYAGPIISIYLAGRSLVCSSTGLPPAGEWAVYGQVLGLVGKRKILWYPWRRSEVIFQTSFEYSGLFTSFRRHGAQIAIAVASSLATLAATGAFQAAWRYLHHGK